MLTIRADGSADLDLDALLLTDAQRQALRIDRNVVVSAGAGSGKTHTLAWRYVRLLVARASEGKDDIESVVVLTFTEKAAEEMAERCQARLQQVLDWAHSHHWPGAMHLERMAERFSSARIHTFHAFCARLIREHPSWTNDQRVDVLEPDVAAAMRQGVLARTVETWARERPDELGRLLDTFGGRRSLLDAAGTAMQAGRKLKPRLEAHRRGNVTVHASAVAPEDIQRWLRVHGLPSIRALGVLTGPGGTAFSRSVASLSLEPPTTLEAVNAYYEHLLSLPLRADGTLRTLTHHTVLGSKASWQDPRRYATAKEALRTLADRMDDWPERYQVARHLPKAADRVLLDVLTPFSDLVLQSEARLYELYAERAVIDFDRMQDLVVDAVEADADLRARLRDQHRWWMVDEFQDTDSRQWTLVRTLGEAPPGEVEDRVFLVGDVKQAIYGFRGGDPTLFAEATRHLDVDPINLPDNFRSRPSLIDWFNIVFPTFLDEGWARIRSARPESGGDIYWLEADDLDEEVDRVSGFIRDLLASSTSASWRTEPKPPIAVLLRTRTHLGVWERAFRETGIPYQVAKGVGFWSRPEVIDVVNLAHAVVTQDRLSWVGVLRGSFVEASDQEVHDFVLDGVWPEGSHRIRQAALLRESTPLLEWLQDAFAWARGRWSLAARGNVDRLIARTDRTLVETELVEQWLTSVQARPRETDFTPSDDPARVVLMTVHASKGLEFPCVVVPELARTPRPPRGALQVSKVDGEWICASKIDDEDGSIQQHIAPALLNRCRDAAKAADLRESARLLYVAATRARDILVLAGPTDASPRSWAGLLSDPPGSTQWPKPKSPERTTSGSQAWVFESDVPQAPPSSGIVELVASDLAAAQTCMLRWYRASRLGDPLPMMADQLAFATRGTVLHGLIEDRCFDDPDVATRRWTSASGGLRLPKALAQRTAAEIETHRRAIANDPVLRQVLDAPGFDELGVLVPFPGGRLKGRIDRLYIDRQRQGFVVLDYKTAQRLQADRHDLQLRVYAWAAQHVLDAHQELPVVGGSLYATATTQMTFLPFSKEALDEVPHRLAALAAVADIEHATSIARTQSERPCESCAFASTCHARRGSAVTAT